MKKYSYLITLLLIVLFTLNGTSWAQNNIDCSISGFVIDDYTQQPIPGTTVNIKGSSKGAVTDDKGAFTINNITSTGEVTLSASFLGYTTQEFSFGVKQGSNRLSSYIRLKEQNIQIEEVVVKGNVPTVVQIGDTTQFNAAAYKTHPDAMAQELLAKMPGFTVSDGGEAEVEGESIAQVYVDGKAYFKDDPTTALNSIPADVIESVQLYEEKSDRTRFTGVDDGERKKTINIVTTIKDKSMKMGDFIAGYGTDNHYNVKSNVNIFGGDHRLTFGFGLNDVNQEALSGSRFYGRYGSSGLKDAAGFKLNYSGSFKKDDRHYTDLAANYILTRNYTEKESIKNQEGLILDESYFSNDINHSRSVRHNLRVDIESQQGDNMIFFRPSFSYTNSASNIFDHTIKKEASLTTNSATTNTNNDAESYKAGGSLRWMHKIDLKNSITIGGNANFSKSNSDQYLYGNSASYELTADELVDSLFNQTTGAISGSNSIDASVAYTYAIKPNQGLNLEYEIGYDWSDSDSKTYLYNEYTGTYDDLYESLSNVFERDYLTQKAIAGYSIMKPNLYSLSARVGYQYASLENNLVYPEDLNYNYNFGSVNANMRAEYSISSSKRLMFSYNGRPILPTVTQLQDVLNTSTPLKVSKGNPYLSQGYSNMMSFRYTTSSISKSTAFNIYANATNSVNGISNSVTTISQDTVINGVPVQSGANLTVPVNTSGIWSVRGGFYYSFPLDLISSKVNLGAAYNYSRSPSIVNGVTDYTTSNAPSISAAINSNISQNVDFTLSNNTYYTRSVSTSEKVGANNYIRNVASAKVNLIWNNFVLNTDYSFNKNFYMSESTENNQYNLLNAGLGYKFLKGNAELRLSAYDLLNQSKSISHTVSDLYVTDAISTVLERYYMLTFSFKFNSLKGNGGSYNSSSMSSGMRGNRSGMGGSMGGTR